MNDLIIHYKKGSLPKSIESALINQQECIDQIDVEIDVLHDEIIALRTEGDVLAAKKEICIEVGMPIKGLKNQLTRNHNLTTRKKGTIDSLIKARKAYEVGFLEIPDLNIRARELDMDNPKEDRDWNKMVLPSDAPLRVFEDLKAAKETGLFEKIVFFEPATSSNADPIIAGRIGRRVFLISNYH